MKGFKRAVSRPQESRALVTNLQGEFVFSECIPSVDSVRKTSTLLAFSIPGLCFAANESPNMGLYCLLYSTPQPMSVNFGGASIDGCRHCSKVWKSASARGNLMRVMRLSILSENPLKLTLCLAPLCSL